MSTTEQLAPTSDRVRPSARPAALAIVLFVSAIAGLVILIFAFTTTNADFSVDGDTATTSSYTGDDQAP